MNTAATSTFIDLEAETFNQEQAKNIGYQMNTQPLYSVPEMPIPISRIYFTLLGNLVFWLR